MDPVRFQAVMEQVLDLVPEGKDMTVGQIVEVYRLVAYNADSGYERSDAKAALLELKAEGKIEINHDGIVSRRGILG